MQTENDSSRMEGQTQPRRRQSKLAGNQNELLGINLDKSKLDKNEVSSLISHFKKFERPIIQFIDLLNLVKKLNYEVNAQVKEFIFKEIEGRNIKKIDIEAAIIVISQVKMYYQRLYEENQSKAFNEYVDVFVALGGNPDQTGKVSKSTILDIIKDEFELTYDMEIFLEKIESGGEFLDFPTFCMLFEQNDEGRTLTKTNSVLSLLSNRSRRSIKSNNSLKVKYKDFEKFYAQMELQEQQQQQQQQTRNHFEQESQIIPSTP